MGVGTRTITGALIVGASLLLVAAVNVLAYPTRNIPVAYVVPLLVAALTLSPRGILITALVAVTVNLISVAVEGTPIRVWPVTSFALLVICFGAYLLGRQREVTRRRTTELGATKRLTSLGRVSDTALATLDLDGLLRTLLDRVREALASDTATILLPTEGRLLLAVRALSGLEEDDFERHTVRSL
jgi:hypothetical protein